jgi:hypothetical protein
MKVLYVFNRHRGIGGSNNATEATIGLSRRFGLDVEVFARSSDEIRSGLWGRLIDGAGFYYRHGAIREFRVLLEAFKPDVVHAYELFPMISPWILPLCTKRRIPVVMTCYDYRLTCPITSHFRAGAVCTKCIDGREYWPVLLNCHQKITDSAALALYRPMIRKFRLFHNHVTHFVAP